MAPLRFDASSILASAGRICTAIAASSVAPMLELAETALTICPFLEFRLDALADPFHALEPLSRFLAAHPGVITIATCRRVESGGNFQGAREEELAVLSGAARSGCHIVDLSIESAEAASVQELTSLRAIGAALLLSFHDFGGSPDFPSVLERMRAIAPDFYKIVSTAHGLTDNLPLLHFLEQRAGERNLVALAMGEPGMLSRVLGLRAGAAFTFASPQSGEPTAPGQVTAASMLRQYRAAELDGQTKVYGVAGSPVRYSLSPVMHNAAFRHACINAVFLPLAARDIDDLLTAVRETPIDGVAVTMPYKQAVLSRLDHVDPLARRVGACNTVVRSPAGVLHGYNTDVSGVIRPLERRLALRGARVLVLGAGGAARAAVFGLIERAAHVFVWNRTPERAEELARQSGARPISRAEISATSFDVILNSTPAGMAGHRLPFVLAPEELRAGLVFDMVYNPLETPLLRAARERGIPVIAGAEMFVQQGARQFELWTGQPAPEDAMTSAALGELHRRAALDAAACGATPEAQASMAMGKS